jgi:two-component system, cell cycle sensor histidine kinase DivJ
MNGRASEIVDLGKVISNYIDTLVPASARRDPLAAARDRAFIAPRLFVSFITLAVFPAYIALRGVPGALDVLIFGWFATPILIAYYLSRTGHDERAQLFSALSLTSLGTTIAAASGGIGSFAVIWLVIVPLEAALFASPRVVAFASTLTFAAVGLLLFLQVQDLLPVSPSSEDALATLSVISAALYATGLAFGAQSLAQTWIRLLREEQSRYRLLSNNMTDAVTRHDASGAILFASPAAEPLFRSKSSDLLGQGLCDRVHVADRPVYLTALADAAAFGRSRTIELRVQREATEPASGGMQFIWVEMHCQPLDRDFENPGTGEREVIALTRDITDRKLQEQAIENMRNELEEESIVKAKFLAVMSHELRTPLNAIIGFSQILSDDKITSGKSIASHDYPRLINESGVHLLSLVNSMLDMSKIDAGNFEFAPEPFLPTAVIVGCCDLLALAIRDAEIDLAMRLDAKLPEITADKRAFRQILINLISNAVKFTNRGGHVTVSAKSDGHEFVMMVEDTGIGVARKDLARLGDPFFQAPAAYDRPKDGTGLGLSVVKGLAALHGGELSIDSRIGKGTRVTVRLPTDCKSGQPLQPTLKRAPRQAIERAIGTSDIKVMKSA